MLNLVRLTLCVFSPTFFLSLSSTACPQLFPFFPCRPHVVLYSISLLLTGSSATAQTFFTPLSFSSHRPGGFSPLPVQRSSFPGLLPRPSISLLPCRKRERRTSTKAEVIVNRFLVIHSLVGTSSNQRRATHGTACPAPGTPLS